ncbi:MAG: ABC transporter substrate-binding protein [Gemmatimonadaceae bacterium]|nr:ABC transporter substrate-binding protein [Gemmatimonadaceae bacterium]
MQQPPMHYGSGTDAAHHDRPVRTLQFLRPVGGALLWALTVTVASACRRPETPKATAREASVAIGVGAAAGRPGYESLRQGMELAVARLNASGAARFRLRFPDSAAVSAVRIAQELRDDPAVLGVVGHPESGQTLEALPVYADAEHMGKNAVVAISPTASSPQLSGISPWFFRVAPSDDVAARFVAQWVQDSLHATRAAVIYRNDSYGRDWASTFADAFVRDGATVVARDPYLHSVTEWDAYATQIARLKPDVLLFPGDTDDAVELLKALREANVTVPFVGGDGTEGLRAHTIAEGAHYVSFFDPDAIETEEGRTFARVYREKYGHDPDMFAAMAYDATLAIGRSVNKGARTRLALRRSLERLGTNGTPKLEGASGLIAFEKNHDITTRRVFMASIPARVPLVADGDIR